MAWLDERNGRYHLCFRFGGTKYKKSLKTGNKKQANQLLARVEENIALVERGRLSIPDEADVATFLLSDGKMANKPAPKSAPTAPQTIGEVFEEYENDLPAGSLEANSLYTARIHMRHIEREIGKNTRLPDLTRSHLQAYINNRLKQAGQREGTVTPTTIRKELATLSSIWAFAASKNYVAGPFPNRPKLNFPKTAEKPRFQTWAEIERKIEHGGLEERQQEELWDALFLTLPEIQELMEHIREFARHEFLIPMVMMAAHTGARRSELLRSEISDIDFHANTLTIREKKRVRGTFTTRNVPLSEQLRDCLAAWLNIHPGGQHTFCFKGKPLSVNQARDHFNRTLAGSKWSVVRGYHVLRHSFASNAAAQGVDQRIINSWMGHQTEAMVRRYRHLLPNQQQAAIESIFGRQ